LKFNVSPNQVGVEMRF